MSERRQIMFFTAPDIEEAEILEGDYLDEDVRISYMKKIVLAKKEAQIREKLPETKEKVHQIMNKASKLL